MAGASDHTETRRVENRAQPDREAKARLVRARDVRYFANGFMPAGLDSLKHIVVLMMQGRSFDHMLGGLMGVDPRIEGLTGAETNPDNAGKLIKVQPLAEFQGQLDPDPAHSFRAVQEQLYDGTSGYPTTPAMQGFVRSYWGQRQNANHSRMVMYYFAPNRLPVLTTLARSFAVFNGWFSSVPGSVPANQAFAHYGTSFGQVGNDTSYSKEAYASIFDRMLQSKRTSKVYYYDQESSLYGAGQVLKHTPQTSATYEQFLQDCRRGTLPDYSLVEPNHTDHLANGVEALASDQHPDHHVQQGELFIGSVYNAIRGNPALWKSTALLIVYDQHGGIYDHVPPPACPPDNFVAPADATGTGSEFRFDRLGVRVPAILVSPWIANGTVVPGVGEPNGGRVFEHASIPATVTQHFIGAWEQRSPREKSAQTFLDLFTDQMRPDSECPIFEFDGQESTATPDDGVLVEATASGGARYQELAGYQSDVPDGEDLLDIKGEVEALAAVMAAKEVQPPLSLGLFGDWGTGKSFFMRQLENRIQVLQDDAQDAGGESAFCENIVQIKFNAWSYIDANLWASLTSEIFEGLAAALARRRGTDSQEARARILAAASSSQAGLAEAERRKAQADEALRNIEERMAALQNSQAEVEASLEPRELLDAAYHFAINQPDVQKNIELAGAEMNLANFETAAGQVKSEILELRGIWSAIFFTIRHTEKLWVWLVAPAVALGLGWICMFLLKRYPLAGIMGQVTTVMVTLSGFLVWFLPGARKALGFIQNARDARQKLIESKKQERAKSLTLQRDALATQVATLQAQVRKSNETAKALNEQLELLRADRRLADYIRQRNESTDYTSQRGLIARVRTDFSQLSSLLRDAEEEADSEIKLRQQDKDHDRKLFPRVDRIVLYIDDLDRCREKTVVEVLQAVNLLLAFPLFVVVVGVDPRWLLHSLEHHSAALGAHSDDTSDPELELLWQSTPLNYLEKILQIPYTLRPMSSIGFGRLVDTLSGAAEKPAQRGGTAATVASAEASGSGATTDASQASSETAAPAKKHSAPSIDRSPEHLRIEDWEKAFMKLLHELIPSPRAGKRFVNIYRLIRASVGDRDRSLFIGDAAKGGEHRCALLLLAMLTGYPAETTEILGELIREDHTETWWTYIDNIKVSKASVAGKPVANGGLQAQRWEGLFSKLDSMRSKLEDHPCVSFSKWAPQIARYSFQSGRVLLGSR